MLLWRACVCARLVVCVRMYVRSSHVAHPHAALLEQEQRDARDASPLAVVKMK